MIDAIESQSNGRANGLETPRDKWGLLGAPRTANYPAPMLDSWGVAPRDLPRFGFTTIQAMLWDPTIRLGLAMREAPLHGAEFAYQEGSDADGKPVWKPGVQARNPDVAAFVLRQLKRIWEYDLASLCRSQIWGWAAAEVLYKHNPETGFVEYDSLLERHAIDVRALEQGGQIVGVRFRRTSAMAGGQVDLGFPKAVWIAFNAAYGSFYGLPVLRGPYSPWADKWFDKGALDVRRLFMVKDSYGGATFKYPPGTTDLESKGEVPNDDIAQEIVEQAAAGHVKVMPSTRGQDGHPLWEWEEPTVPNNPQHILQYPKDLDIEILRAMEIPDDILTSENTGAWEGKKVPQQAFYCGLDKWLGNIVSGVVKQVLERLVFLNWGHAEDFQVCTKPLALQVQEQTTRLQKDRQPPQPQFQQYPPADPYQLQRQQGQQGQPMPQQRLSLDGANDPAGWTLADVLVGQAVTDAAQLVKATRLSLANRIRMDAEPRKSNGKGLHWITIGGGDDGEAKHAGGTRVLIDGDGNIHAGFGSGKNLKDLGDHKPKEASFDPSEWMPKREPLAPSNRFHQEVLNSADEHDLDPHDLKETAEHLWREKRQYEMEREAAKQEARERTGLTQRDIDRLENSGQDYTSSAAGSAGQKLRHFDAYAQELAREEPALGLGDPDDSSTDFAAKLWEVLREGKRDLVPKHDPELLADAAHLLKHGSKAVFSQAAYAFALGRTRFAGFDESKHPRGQPENAGQFGKGGGGKKPAVRTRKDKKRTIVQAAKELQAKGYELLGAVETGPHQTPGGPTRYRVKVPTGETKIMTVPEIEAVVNAADDGHSDKRFPAETVVRTRQYLHSDEADDLSAWTKKLTPENKDAIHWYTDQGYSRLNRGLRSCPETLDCLDEDTRKNYLAVNEALSKSKPFPKPKVVYRGIRLSDEKKSALVSSIETALKDGNSVRFNGVISTSLDPSVAWNFSKNSPSSPSSGVVFEILAKSGAYVDRISSTSGEDEVIHQHGKKYKPVSIKQGVQFRNGSHKGTATVIQLEENDDA